MTDTKISALPVSSDLSGAEALPIVQGAATRRATVADIRRAPMAASILARASHAEAGKLALYSGAAPVWTLSGASTIVSGVQRSPRRAAQANTAYAANTAVAVDSDPNFRYVGAPTMAYGTAYPDYLAARPPLLIGGAGQFAYWTPRIAFNYDGQVFEWFGKAYTASVSLRLRVNGRLVTSDFAVVGSSLTAGNLYYFKCDLGSAASRLIEIDFQPASVSFGGIISEPSASLTRGPSPSLRLCALTDSIGADTAGYSRVTSWAGQLTELFGGDVGLWSAGIGGSGYASSTPGTDDFITRVPDVVAARPDILFIEGGQNDGSQTAAQIQTLATNLLAALNAQLPRTLIFVVGSYPFGTPSVLKMQHDAALRSAAAAQGAYFISLVDPSNATVSGSGVPNWTASTTYDPGDGVIDPSGRPQTCTASHFSSGAFDQTKFRPTSVIYGTGRAGAATGDGNADVAVQGDGVHPTLRGSNLLARVIYQGAMAHLRGIATTSAAALAY